MARDSLVLELARSQHGLVSRVQAIAAGMSAHAVDWRVSSGEWEPMACGVYRLPGASPSWHQRALAVCLQGEPNVALSHRSAGYVWRLDGLGRGAPKELEVVIPRGRELKAEARVRYTRHFERGMYRGMPVTPLSRTLIDLAPVLTESDLEQALDAALRFGLRALKPLQAKLKETRPSRALKKLQEMVAAYDGSLDSALEVIVRKLLWAAGLPKPRVHYNVWHERKWIANVDFAWPQQKLLVQAHGLKWHLNARRFRIDMRQQSQLAAAGWLQLTTTWDEANHHPARFIECARAAWARASGLLGQQPRNP